MDKEEFKNIFNEYAKEINVELNDNKIDKFYKYMNLLLEWNEKINLTAITDYKEIILKHFIDSLTIEKYIKKNSYLVDIGTGAGFPGIPLKIFREDINMVLLDSLNKRINFIQNLRSREDYIYKHSLNVAILCALMSHVLNMKWEEQMELVAAALVHDIGKMSIPKAIAKKDNPNEDELEVIATYEKAGYELIGTVFPSQPGMKRLCAQMNNILSSAQTGNNDQKGKVSLGAKVLAVADTYDAMTAMRLDQPPESEVVAIKHLVNHPDIYEPAIVDALIQSIDILAPGVSVELSTREKAIVIRNNEENVLRPMVLAFKDNNIIDLSSKSYQGVEVTDIMKTMDNRYVIDTQTLIDNGFSVPVKQEAEMQIGIAQEESEEAGTEE